MTRLEEVMTDACDKWLKRVHPAATDHEQTIARAAWDKAMEGADQACRFAEAQAYAWAIKLARESADEIEVDLNIEPIRQQVVIFTLRKLAEQLEVLAKDPPRPKELDDETPKEEVKP